MLLLLVAIGTSTEYVGDSSITCPRVSACYVSCQADCNDLQPAKGGGRCFSRLACRTDILLLRPAGRVALTPADDAAAGTVDLE